MKQLTQQLKSGNMEILEVPFPTLNKGQILVRNLYSVISAGTEGKTVTDARKGYIAKARSRQKEVKQVIELIKTTGFLSTYQLVMNKLEAPSPLGYSCAGEVIAVGDGVNDLHAGDYVAAGGQGAYHADVVAVYRNLCVKLPKEVDLSHAAFATISAIALQGIRQADLQSGGNCVVIGLGLIGQLTMQLLNASGITPFGIDIDPKQIELSHRLGFSNVYNRNQEGLERLIVEKTRGFGTDAVIITAGSSSLDPVEFAGVLCRKKGKVVIVGAVPTGFSREHYYKKELDLRMSSSYGPGRYDPNYEEHGNDYPIGFVRWTENRNMQTFISLLERKRLDIDKLITHIFPLENAPEAYNMILSRSEPFAGILIRYDTDQELKNEVIFNEPLNRSPQVPDVGFLGAGNFAQSTLLPNMKGLCNFKGILTAQGNESVYVGKKYGFSYATDNADRIITDPGINTIFILTRHNLHAEYVIKCLKNGKNVFVEKPLAMTKDQLEEIRDLYMKTNGIHLMLGFNRRFSPFIKTIRKKFLPDQAKAINIRINAGFIPREHWVHDPEFGGGRIIGEACHFFDLAMHLAGSPVKRINSFCKNDPSGLMDTIVVNLSFTNGSIATISYFSNGNKNLPKENIEVFCDGAIAVINDFKEMHEYGERIKKTKSSGQDKGHKGELEAFFKSVREGLPTPIPFTEIYHTMLVTFLAIDSIKTGRTIEL